MSEHDRVFRCGDGTADAAAYMLNALEPDEARAFEEHLETCVICRHEVQEFGQVVDALALSPPAYAVPRRLRRSVLRAARRELRAAGGEARAGSVGRRGIARHLPRPVTGLGLGLGGAVAAAAAVALAVAGGLSSAGSSGSERTIAASVRGVPGTAEVQLSGGHGELVVHHLPAPAAGEIYEVWVKRSESSEPRPTSLFSVNSDGDGVAEAGDLRHVAEVMVTQEPAGGTSRPTSTPIIVARLT